AGRTVASASTTAQATRNRFAEYTPGILCSPLRSSLQGRIRSHSHDGGSAINYASLVPVRDFGTSNWFYWIKYCSAVSVGRPPPRRKCPVRQILPGHLRSLNHNRAKLCGNTARQSMRIFGPNGITLRSEERRVG